MNIRIHILFVFITLANAAFNGVNVVAKTSNFMREFNSLSTYIATMLSNASVSATASGFLNKITVQNMTYNIILESAYAKLVSLSENTVRLTYYFDILATSASALITRFFFSKTNVPNIYVCTTGTSAYISFDVAITYANSQIVFTMSSDVTFGIGSKIVMYTILKQYPPVEDFYSSWLLSTGKKFITESLPKTFTTVTLNAYLQGALTSLANQYQFAPVNFGNGAFYMNNVLLGSPIIAGEYIQYQFDGQVYRNGTIPLNTSATAIPQSVTGIANNYQYVLSQDLVQSILSTFQAAKMFSVKTNLTFSDVTIYNALCNSTASPVAKITPNGLNITMIQNCTMYTNYFGNFNGSFYLNTLFNISLANSAQLSGYNSISLYPVSFTTSNTTIYNPSKNVSYTVIKNHINDLVASIYSQYYSNMIVMPIPTPMLYTGLKWKNTINYYAGYAVLGEDQ